MYTGVADLVYSLRLVDNDLIDVFTGLVSILQGTVALSWESL